MTGRTARKLKRLSKELEVATNEARRVREAIDAARKLPKDPTLKQSPRPTAASPKDAH